MKLLNADKLVEFIEANFYDDFNRFGKIVDKDDLLSFISTNSIEVEQIKPKGIVEINDEIMEREYENYLDAIYIHKADVKTTDKSCPTCEHYSTDVDDEGYPIVLAPCDICGDDMDNWTPKLDKVEREI